MPYSNERVDGRPIIDSRTPNDRQQTISWPVDIGRGVVREAEQLDQAGMVLIR